MDYFDSSWYMPDLPTCLTDDSDTIFVMIASYRDPELVPTIKDCIQKAKFPHRLSFGICWQHDASDDWDNLDEFKNLPNFTIMDVPALESKGACWARHHIQNMWTDQKYVLQLDSHHRFIENWDEVLIAMMGLTGVNKPFITAYVAPYNPKDSKLSCEGPYKIDAKFSNDIILFTPSHVDNYLEMTKPFPTRFASGHFFFTLGNHCRECLYDPDLYFTGEEISLSVRSFTLGYELFHPHRNVIYHEYTRNGRTKHWDDFCDESKKQGKVKQTWGEIDLSSKDRVRVLLKQLVHPNIDLGKYVLGTERTLEEYELYAGINFKKCLFHPDTQAGKFPPINDTNYDWITFNKEYKFSVEIPKIDMTDIKFLYVGVENEHNSNLYRQDLVKYQENVDIVISSHLKPHHWIFWPFSNTTEWGKKQEFLLNLTD